MITQITERSGLIRRYCRWIIPGVYVASLILFCLMLLGEMYRETYESCSFVGTVILAVFFLFMALSTENKTVRYGLWAIVLSQAIIVFFDSLIKNYFGWWGQTWLSMISMSLFLSGVIMICKDKNVLSRAPQLTMLYLFMLGSAVIVHALQFSIWKIAPDITMFVALFNVYWLVFYIVSVLFWFKVLKKDFHIDYLAAAPKPLRIPAVHISVVLLIISFVIFFNMPLLWN